MRGLAQLVDPAYWVDPAYLPTFMKTSNGSAHAGARVEQGGSNPRSKPGAASEQALFSDRNPDSRALLNALTKLKSGDYSVRLPLHWSGAARKVADALREIVF